MKLLLLTSYICLSVAYSNTPTQYHIQTDDGANRYFRYQTYNGQYRKEKRFEDGTVVGTYGWVDANNYLRLYNYIADKNGYRIISAKKLKVNPPRRIIQPTQIRPAVQSQRKVPTHLSVTRGNSIGNRRHPKPQPEFINSKLHPKLQPNYSEESEESEEENFPSQRRQSGPEFINSKLHPKLRPEYSSSQNKRQIETEYSDSVEEAVIPQRRQPLPEFTNSKTHVKLRPLYSRKRKRQSFRSKKDTYISQGSATSLTSQKKVPEFINSKIHPKLQPNYSSNTRKTILNQDSFGQRRKPTTASQSVTNDKRLQNSASNQATKSTTTPAEFRMDEPGGRITMDFDLGNQYRKEKAYPDGRIVGEHGYVDPLGILRKTFYSSGPGGLKQEKVSYWVGTRNPGS